MDAGPPAGGISNPHPHPHIAGAGAGPSTGRISDPHPHPSGLKSVDTRIRGCNCHPYFERSTLDNTKVVTVAFIPYPTTFTECCNVLQIGSASGKRRSYKENRKGSAVHCRRDEQLCSPWCVVTSLINFGCNHHVKLVRSFATFQYAHQHIEKVYITSPTIKVDYISPQLMKRSISPLNFSKHIKLPPKAVLKNHSKSQKNYKIENLIVLDFK